MQRASLQDGNSDRVGASTNLASDCLHRTDVRFFHDQDAIWPLPKLRQDSWNRDHDRRSRDRSYMSGCGVSAEGKWARSCQEVLELARTIAALTRRSECHT